MPWSEDQRTRNWWPEVVRLKGVGRSPLSVARVGLLAVGPGRDKVRSGERNTERGKRAKKDKPKTKVKTEYCVFRRSWSSAKTEGVSVC